MGVDAPRRPLTSPRQWYWSASKGWRRRRPSDVGNGRHCEVVVAAHRIARPQWTPLSEAAPRWMQIGFELFAALHAAAVYEVFPSASYAMLKSDPDCWLTIDLAEFTPGPKDMLDAFVAAFTVREFVMGRGMAVGDGDGLGAIVLPRPLSRTIPGVLTWPSEQQEHPTDSGGRTRG